MSERYIRIIVIMLWEIIKSWCYSLDLENFVAASTSSVAWWLGGRALNLRFTGRGFNSRPVRFHVT